MRKVTKVIPYDESRASFTSAHCDLTVTGRWRLHKTVKVNKDKWLQYEEDVWHMEVEWVNPDGLRFWLPEEYTQFRDYWVSW